jgi:MFS family permease
VRRFPRRVMFLLCTCSMLCVYIGWTISVERFLATQQPAVAKLTIFFIFAYSPCYNLAYNALTYTYLVELFPFTVRTKGISIFQLFGRLAAFFTTFVNPIGLGSISWKWLLVYVCWICFEIVVIYFLFPETGKRTLEELTFCMSAPSGVRCVVDRANTYPSVRRQGSCRRSRHGRGEGAARWQRCGQGRHDARRDRRRRREEQGLGYTFDHGSFQASSLALAVLHRDWHTMLHKHNVHCCLSD